MSIILMKLVMNGGWKAELLNGGMGNGKEGRMSIILMKLVMNGGWKAELLNGGMGRGKEGRKNEYYLDEAGDEWWMEG